MELIDIFRTFTNGIADIEYFRSTLNSAVEREAEHLQEQKEIIAQGGFTGVVHIQSMFFQDVTSGKPVFYGFRKTNVSDAIKNIETHNNRQHQWLLAEAYELFEDYINLAYAYMGQRGPERWPLRDFGSIQWEEVNSKGFDWYFKQAQQKKDVPLGAMRQFRKVLPRMASVEPENRMGYDLQVAVMLIARMRHQIVHTKGVIKDKKIFLEDLITKLGYSGIGSGVHMKYLAEMLILRESDGAIWLLNVKEDRSTPSFTVYADNFTELVRVLIYYAHQIYISLGGKIIERIDEEE